MMIKNDSLSLTFSKNVLFSPDYCKFPRLSLTLMKRTLPLTFPDRINPDIGKLSRM